MKNFCLVSARKNKGFTQEQLADLLGYKKSTISNWENGYSSPSLMDAFKVAELLERDINYLFSLNRVQENYTSSAYSSTINVLVVNP